MTEAGEKWACEVRSKLQKWPAPVNEQTEIMLRAFCDEVEKRAQDETWADSQAEAIANSFSKLKRELLGDR